MSALNIKTIDPRLALKVALWAVPVLFGLGAMYQSLVGSSAQVSDVAADIEEHAALESHPVTGMRLDILVTEQRALRGDVAKQAANIAAICQATGANCR